MTRELSLLNAGQEAEMHDTVYKLRSTMKFQGTPVNWNARAIIWSGNDWREPIRHQLRRASGHVRRGRLRAWLGVITDNRDFARFDERHGLARRILGTRFDVEARKSWSAANKYWRQTERKHVAA